MGFWVYGVKSLGFRVWGFGLEGLGSLGLRVGSKV